MARTDSDVIKPTLGLRHNWSDFTLAQIEFLVGATSVTSRLLTSLLLLTPL